MNKEALSQLGGFTGTGGYHRLHPNLLLTDGARFLAENADCFWLMDVIWSYQKLCQRDASLRDMQFWKLVKELPERGLATQGGMLSGVLMPGTRDKKAAYVICERDSNDVAIVQGIDLTDFPFEAFPSEGLKLYCAPADGQRMVVLLPSEY